MILKFNKNYSYKQIYEFKLKLDSENVESYLVNYKDNTIIVCSNNITDIPEYVESKDIKTPYKLASKEFQDEKTIVDVDGVKLGGKKIIMIAGPCAVESRESLIETAHFVKSAGADFLRGGAFKPRTSPYSFRGLKEEGLKILAEAKDETGLKIVTEVMTPTDVKLVAEYADVLQIGARNMQNYQLLDEVGKSDKPVMLKRGMSATVKEWLLSAEYILSQGNPDVILCERGIRTYETALRNTLDLSVVPLLSELTHLPVIVDPSHGTGKRSLINPMSKASIAAGTDGVMVEVHPSPEHALSDGEQSLTFQQFANLMEELKTVTGAFGRVL
ncbi:3-deoxy-7-phosphoheptulonate synthase [Methanosarcina sp. UBA411]|jgi:3-deoxy-7-phosphoheptulonate synthase|uniref:3-deoxy-7-phosphoheptulonate synthase n=1 Tax=Methanosarcina sp. UBA411 TaxID=1915589 RepID=UPI0025EA7ACA|nr:3-deoxy-7-phosphoheptulonate synthase [Methanosarcina sp. UBA411]